MLCLGRGIRCRQPPADSNDDSPTVRGPTRSAKIPSAKAWRAWVDTSHDKCVGIYRCIPRSQPAPGRQGPAYKNLDYRRGKVSNLVTWSLWFLFAFSCRHLTPFVTAIVDPPSQRTASAGSTTRSTPANNSTQVYQPGQPSAVENIPPRLPGRCQPAHPTCHAVTYRRLPRSRTRGR